MSLAALTHNLFLGGANTLLLNFLRALPGGPRELRIVSFGTVNEHAADFAAVGADVCEGPMQQMIYEDRLRWAYRQVASRQPRAVLSWLGSESFEVARLAPPGVARLGVVQAFDPAVYGMVAQYRESLDAVIGVSEGIAEHLRTLPEFRGMRVEGIPNGIEFPPAVPRLPRAPGQPLRVLYLGRLVEEQKRISRVVQLANLLRDAPVQFTIAGSGPEEAVVRACAATCPAASVIGAIPNTAVTELLRQHDVFLLLSDFEGLPMSLLEAMGEGVVPLISNLPGGMAAAVPPSAGLRIPVNDQIVSHAAETLRQLAGDPARLGDLSAGAAHHARTHFTAERMVQRYLELVEEFSSPAPVWAAEVEIPVPHGVQPWLFSGWRRPVRRWLKRLRHGRPPAAAAAST